MHIVKLELPPDILTKYGLTSVKLDKLKPIVIVTGKNGAGKSRLFEAINEFIQRIPLNEEKNQHLRKIEDTEQALRQYQSALSHWQQNMLTSKNEAEKSESERNIRNTEKPIGELKSQIISFNHI